jgi:hypothetical protein
MERSGSESRVVENSVKVSSKFCSSIVRKYKMQSTSSMMGDDTVSVISETPSVFTGKVTHAEKNLTRMDGNRAKELETLKSKLMEAQEELAQTKSKLSAISARKETIEKELSTVKSTFTSKMQILI